MWFGCLTPHSLLVFLSDTGVKTATTVPQAAATPVKRLDNLFFIEEPKNISVTESKSIPNVKNHKINFLDVTRQTIVSIRSQKVLCTILSVEGTATFIAKIGGDPIPSVKWMKGKWRQITPGGRISIHHKGQDARMEIREVTKSDAGTYRCVATNKHGEIECSSEMEVNKKEEAEQIEDVRAMLKR